MASKEDLLELVDLFTSENCVSKRGEPTTPKIIIGRKGKISLNKPAFEKLGIKAGHRIAIGQGKENEFFILNVGPARSGFNMKLHSSGKYMEFSNADLVKRIYNIVDPNTKMNSHSFLLGKAISIKTAQHSEDPKAGTQGFCMLHKKQE